MVEFIQKYLFLVIVFSLFLVLIFALYFIIKKQGKNNYNLYGMFLNLKNNEIFALSLIIINYLFLTYFLIFKLDFSIAFAVVSEILILLSFILVLKWKALFINLLINGVNVSTIYLANLINEIKLANTDNYIYFFLQVAINLFGLFFYMFTHLKFIKDIRKVKNEKENN